MAWKPEQTDDLPDLTPMIDVVFLLIVFFMVVGKMISDEKIEIKIPDAEASKVPEDAGSRDTITLTADGSLFKGVRPVSIDELKNLIAKGNNTIKGYRVYLRVDQYTPHREVQKVLKACSEAGAINIIFAAFESPQS